MSAFVEGAALVSLLLLAAYWGSKLYIRKKLALFARTLALFQDWTYMATDEIEPLLKRLVASALGGALERPKVAEDLWAIIKDERYWKVSQNFGHEGQAVDNVGELKRCASVLDIPLNPETVDSLYGRIAENITRRLEANWQSDDQKGYMTAKAALMAIHLAGRDHDLKPRVLKKMHDFGDRILQAKVREALPYAQEFKFKLMNEAISAVASFAQEAGVDSRPHIHILQKAMRDALENTVGGLGAG